jgi:hypothetical protein
MDKEPIELREKLRAQMIENASEINRIYRRIHETFKRRDESDELRQEWSQACNEAHLRYSELCLPGGWYPDLYDRIKAGDPDAIEVALCFLEVRPYFFRSGYHWKTILQKCKRAPMSGEQAERFKTLFENYNEWKKLRTLSSQRGAAVRHELWPVIRRFHNLFPVRIADFRFDGVATVGDLYALLCTALKVEPLTDPDNDKGTVRQPCRVLPQADMSIWAREFGAWREAAWTQRTCGRHSFPTSWTDMDSILHSRSPPKRSFSCRARNDSWLSVALRSGESPQGVSPRGARRTVRDALASYGSHQGATAHPDPVCEQVRRTAGDRRDPTPCTPEMIAQLLVFLSGPVDQFVIQLADH